MDGLTLDRALKKCNVTEPYYRGVYSIDTVPPVVKYPGFIVVNTDLSSNAGKHWLIFFYVTRDSIEIFDSLGQSPYAYGLYMKRFIVNNPRVHFIYVNKRLQSLKSNVCGAHCLFFAYKKCCKKLSLPLLIHKFYLDSVDYNDCRALCFAQTKFKISARMIEQMLKTVSKKCNLNDCAADLD